MYPVQHAFLCSFIKWRNIFILVVVGLNTCTWQKDAAVGWGGGALPITGFKCSLPVVPPNTNPLPNHNGDGGTCAIQKAKYKISKWRNTKLGDFASAAGRNSHHRFQLHQHQQQQPHQNMNHCQQQRWSEFPSIIRRAHDDMPYGMVWRMAYDVGMVWYGMTYGRVWNTGTRSH